MTEKTPEQEAYERGFQDGWNAAIKTTPMPQNFVIPYTPYVPPPFQPYVPPYMPYAIGGCSVCGMTVTSTFGYVCPNFNCPSKVTCGNSNRNENL